MTGEEVLTTFLGIVYWGLIGYGAVRPFITPAARYNEWTLTSASGREYKYASGNNLRSYPAFGAFNGIDITLPIFLPHIYLDSLKAGGIKIGAVLDESQRIVLEGDFNEYFSVFVPRPYEAVALSILTPDVMQTFKDHASPFDVELFGDRLRIITDKNVLNDPLLEEEMVASAKFILKEIEDKQRGWSYENDERTFEQDLLVYRSSGFRIFGSYVSWRQFLFGLFWAGCTLPFALTGLLLFDRKSYLWSMVLAVVAASMFWFFQKLTAAGEREASFRSRRG